MLTSILRSFRFHAQVRDDTEINYVKYIQTPQTS